MKVSARTADAAIRNRLTAFNTGLAPSRIRPYIITVRGESAPTSINVVLKSSKDIRNEIAAEPNNAGRKYGNTMVRKTAGLDAPRLNAASSRVRSKRRRRALMVSVAMVAMQENWPSTTNGSPGRKKSSSQPSVSSANSAMRLANARMEIPRITPGMTSGASISTDNACLPGKRPRSSRNALAVPSSTDRSVTQRATMQLVKILPMSSESANNPVRPFDEFPKNQSSVKPRQGGAG